MSGVEETYRVWFHPGSEWFSNYGLTGGPKPRPEHYPVVSKSGLSKQEAEDFVRRNAGYHPEYYRIEAELLYRENVEENR